MPYQDPSSVPQPLYTWDTTPGQPHTTTSAHVATLVQSQSGWGSGLSNRRGASIWGHGGWPGERDPAWDGVTLVPKPPASGSAADSVCATSALRWRHPRLAGWRKTSAGNGSGRSATRIHLIAVASTFSLYVYACAITIRPCRPRPPRL
jgi:hypothetical protein